MPYTDIFEKIEIPRGIPKDPRGLVKLGLGVMELARNEQSRRKFNIAREDSIISRSGEFAYPIVSWGRRTGGTDAYMNIVDKRSNKAGLLLSVRAGSERPGVEVVKMFVVNDELVNRGLVRVINQGYPDDVANQEIDVWQRSEVAWPINSSISVVQRIDYAKAVASVFIPKE